MKLISYRKFVSLFTDIKMKCFETRAFVLLK